jgi:hypothetical protein
MVIYLLRDEVCDLVQIVAIVPSSLEQFFFLFLKSSFTEVIFVISNSLLFYLLSYLFLPADIFSDKRCDFYLILRLS